jgi:hypothetical protein
MPNMMASAFPELRLGVEDLRRIFTVRLNRLGT